MVERAGLVRVRVDELESAHAEAVDRRGVARLVDGNGNGDGTGTCGMGAVEAAASPQAEVRASACLSARGCSTRSASVWWSSAS